MALTIQFSVDGMELKRPVETKIRRTLEHFDRRLASFEERKAFVRLQGRENPASVELDLRVVLGSNAHELISHQTATTADHAVRLGVEDLERQLERLLSTWRGEPSFGVPSRREPKEHRPRRAVEPESIPA